MQIKKWKPENFAVNFARFMFKMSIMLKRISLEGKDIYIYIF